jgi:hypothetical protein
MRLAFAFGLLVIAAPARAEEVQPTDAPPIPSDEPSQPAETAPPAVTPPPSFRGFQLGMRTGYARTLDSTHSESVSYGTPSLLPVAFDAATARAPRSI